MDGPQIVLSWGSARDAASYEVHRDSSPYFRLQTLGTSFHNVQVVPGQTYRYAIVASNVAGSTESNSVVATAPMCQQKGTVAVIATLDDQPWLGPVAYHLIGPTPAVGATAPGVFTERSPGSYEVSLLSGGPAGALRSTSPSASQTLSPGGTAVVTLGFKSIRRLELVGRFTGTWTSPSTGRSGSLSLRVTPSQTVNGLTAVATFSDHPSLRTVTVVGSARDGNELQLLDAPSNTVALVGSLVGESLHGHYQSLTELGSFAVTSTRPGCPSLSAPPLVDFGEAEVGGLTEAILAVSMQNGAGPSVSGAIPLPHLSRSSEARHFRSSLARLRWFTCGLPRLPQGSRPGHSR